MDPGQAGSGELERAALSAARRPGPRRSPAASAGCGAGWAWVLSGSSSVSACSKSTPRPGRLPARPPGRGARPAPARGRLPARGGAPRASRARARASRAPVRSSTDGHHEPEPRRRGREERAADGGADHEADLPGERRDRHVATDQPRVGEVDDERRLDRAVQALAEREDRDGDREQREGGHPRQPEAARRDEQPRRRRDDAEQREQRDPPASLGEPRRRQLQEARSRSC